MSKLKKILNYKFHQKNLPTFDEVFSNTFTISQIDKIFDITSIAINNIENKLFIDIIFEKIDDTNTFNQLIQTNKFQEFSEKRLNIVNLWLAISSDFSLYLDNQNTQFRQKYEKAINHIASKGQTVTYELARNLFQISMKFFELLESKDRASFIDYLNNVNNVWILGSNLNSYWFYANRKPSSKNVFAKIVKLAFLEYLEKPKQVIQTKSNLDIEFVPDEHTKGILNEI